MSKYTDNSNDDGIECPYCGDKSFVEAESYSEDTREVECDACEKKFWQNESFTVSHEARPDCDLNGSQHQWEPITLRSGKSHDFCAECGECRAVEAQKPHE
jgi:DNA-directed RNA polymerase subunit RPC12/RpoP